MFLEKYKKLIAALACVVIILIFMLISAARGNSSSFAENLYNTALSPFQKCVTYMSDGVKGFFVFVSEMNEYKNENDSLSKQISELKSDYRSAESYREENERLTALLEIKQNSYKDVESTGARIIGRGSDNWYNEFIIDKGSVDGIEENFCVVTEDGLVGRIKDVGINWARVSTLVDSSMSVGVTVVRTGDVAMIEGADSLKGDGLCKLTYVNKDAQIVEGDILKTSGLGNMFIPGIPAGRVVSIETDETGISKYAKVEPMVNLSDTKVVLVLKNKKED